MIQCKLVLSKEESDLLWTIREIGFGELYGVEIRDGEQGVELTVNQAEQDLIRFIRCGTQYLDILHVHQGAPFLAEIDYKSNGFRCRKRIRFPTSKPPFGGKHEEGC